MRVIGQSTGGAQPDVLDRRRGLRIQVVDGIDRTEVERPLAHHETADLLGQALGDLGGRAAPIRERLGHRYLRHRRLVIETGLWDMERRGEGEDRIAVLDGDDTPRREGVTVAAAIDLVDDGPVEVAATQEISVERMHLTTRIDRRVGCGERLAEHLPAEDLWATDISALAAEKIDLQPLELELAQQIRQLADQDAVTPNRFCITGLVVVYCRNCFFSG